MKQIKNYDYFIDTQGNVYRNGSNKALKPDIGTKGYKRVSLSKNGKVTRFLVHRLVAEAFIPNPDNKPHINHIDNNPSNNNVSNIEWCTESENMIHSHKQGRCSNLKASKKAQELQREKTNKKYTEIFKENLIEIIFKNRRSWVKYHCKSCNNIYTHRIDNPSVKREGICRSCFISKDEDIV